MSKGGQEIRHRSARRVASVPVTARTQSGGLALTQFLGLNDNNEAVGYCQTNNGSRFGFLFNLATKTDTFLDDPQHGFTATPS